MESGIKLHGVKHPVGFSLPKIQNFILVAWIFFFFFKVCSLSGRLLLLLGNMLPFKNKSPCFALSALPLLGKS